MERWENEQNNSEMMIYTTEDGLTKIETTFDGDTVWLSIDQMAELFQRDKSTISRHVKNIFTEGELKREEVVANFATTAADGKTYHHFRWLPCEISARRAVPHLGNGNFEGVYAKRLRAG